MSTFTQTFRSTISRSCLTWLIALLLGITLAPRLSASSSDGYGASAYGTDVRAVGTAFNSNTTALSGICTFQTGVSNHKSVVGVSLAPVLTVGMITTSSSSATVAGGGEAEGMAQVNNVSLLSGLITANTITSVSNAVHNAAGHSVNSTGSSLANLIVNGIPIAVNVPPNTVIPLPFLGHVTLNEQIGGATATQATLTVNAIHVHISVFPNTFNLPLNSEIIVSHAFSKTEIAPGLIVGSSNNIHFSGLPVTVGPVENNVIPCAGTPGGNVVTRSLTGINLALVSAGPLTTTAQGSTTTTTTSGETTASITNLNLLTGLITADLIKADAHASDTGGVDVTSDSGSTVVNLQVAGVTYSSLPPANTQIPLPGLGTVFLHRVSQGTHGIGVVMIDVVVNVAPNAFSLPLGAELTVGTASAKVLH